MAQAVAPAVGSAFGRFATANPGTMFAINNADSFALGLLGPMTLKGLLEKKPRDGSVTKIKVFVGQGETNNEGLGGDMPDLQTYDRDGRAVTDVARAKDKLAEANSWDYILEPAKWDHGYATANAPPHYLSLRHCMWSIPDFTEPFANSRRRR